MKYTLRALLALTLLVGFYVFAIAVVVGLGWLAVELARAGLSGYALGKLWLFVIIIGFVVLRALFGRRRNATAEPGGLLVEERTDPALWSEVRRIAEFAGTRAPDEIRLVPDVNAAVSEDARWLGLVSGTRRLYLGVPLSLGLTTDQLRSVLAHELGHYSGKHTALGAITYRGQVAIARVIDGLGADSLTAKLFKLYARLYYAVSHSVNRRQELEADRLSAGLVGSATASEALRELAPLSSAWDFYLESYADLGSAVGHRPTDLYDGFRAFLASPVRQEQLAEIRTEAREPARSVFDSHPPTSERIARLARLDKPSAPDSSGPASALISAATLARAQEVLWEGDPRTATPLAAIVPLAGAEVVRHNARVARAQLHAAGESPDLTGALELFRSSRAAELLRPLNPEADDEVLRQHAGRLVGDLAAAQLVESGRAAHRLNYDAEWRFTDAEGNDVEPWAPAVAAAMDAGETDGFTAWLQAHGVELADGAAIEDLSLPQRELPPANEVLAACAPVGGRFRTVVVLGQGLVLRRPTWSDRLAAGKSAYFGDPGTSMIRNALKGGVDDLLASPRATVIPWGEITAATYRGKVMGRGVLTLEAASGGPYTVKLVVGTTSVGDPVAVVEQILGSRFRRA